MDLLPTLAAIGGLVLLAVMLQDAFEVMLLPRRVRRRLRIAALWFRFAWRTWRGLGRRIKPGSRRESFLGPFGPMSMLLLFAIWAGGLIVGFGLLYWAFQAPPHASPLFEQIYMSGVTFFTLGYGDVVPKTIAARATSVIQAGCGIGFIAVVIGYLPVLYQFFSRREAHVIQLDGRAGSPPSSATLLARHAEADGMNQLDLLLRDWEVWASELLESHLSYPMLAYYRSQHDNESWLAALGCVMDTCALVLVGIPEIRPLQARMTFTMARQVLVEMARSFGVHPARYTGADRLDALSYDRLVAHLVDAGVAWDPAPISTPGPLLSNARDTLAMLRATYEPLLHGLAEYLMLHVPPWLPGIDSQDNWQQGPRGLIAARLIEELSTRQSPAGVQSNTSRMAVSWPWKRLRSRLRRPASKL